MTFFNKQVASNVPLNADYNSPATPLKTAYMYAMAANVTGTPTGSIKLQACNDPETNTTIPTGIPYPQAMNWVDIDNSTFTLNSAGETMWNVRAVAYNYVRVVYTDASGGSSTATMNLVVNVKG